MSKRAGVNILAPSGQSARRELQLRAALAAGSQVGDSKYWLPQQHSADSAFLASSPEYILSRSRDIADNDPLIYTINERVVNHVIHTGVFPKFNFDHLPEKEDNDTLNKAWKQGFDLWAEYFCHKSNLWPLGIMQRRIFNTQRIDGSLFVGFSVDRTVPDVCPLRLSIYEIDHLDKSVNGPQKDGALAINGLVFDRDGEFVRAHLFPVNPHNNHFHTAQKSVAVPESDLIYTFFSRRAGQRLGRPVSVPIMSLARDLDEYQELVMKKVKHETSDGGWLEGGTSEDLEGMSGGPNQPALAPDGGDDDWPVRWNEDGTVSGNTEIVQAGLMMRTLPSGAKIVRPQTSAPIAQHESFTDINANRIAVAGGAGGLLGTGNYNGISFSGAGHQKIDVGRDFECEQYEISKSLIRHIYNAYIHYSMLYGTAPKPELPDYERLPQKYWMKVTPRFSREKYYNRGQEVRASTEAINSGLSNEEEEAAAGGLDYYENIEAQKRAARAKRELLKEQLENAKILAEIKGLETGKTDGE